MWNRLADDIIPPPRPLTLQNQMQQQSPQNQTPTPAQRPSNFERLAQWRAAAERTGNKRLLHTVDILETLYANEATRPPAPHLKVKGGEA